MKIGFSINIVAYHQLSKDVRVGQTDLRERGSPSQWINVIVVDGALAGKRGWVAGVDLGRF